MNTHLQRIHAEVDYFAKQGEPGYCPHCCANVCGVTVGSGYGVQTRFGFSEYTDNVCGIHGDRLEPARVETETCDE